MVEYRQPPDSFVAHESERFVDANVLLDSNGMAAHSFAY
jgi:hypothetical protein